MKKIASIAIVLAFLSGMALNADPVDTTTVSFELGCPPDPAPNTLKWNDTLPFLGALNHSIPIQG